MIDKPNIVFFDTEENFENLLPISYTRPVADFRVGITTIREKWESMLHCDVSYKTVDYLQEKFPPVADAGGIDFFVAGCVIPDEALAAKVGGMKKGDVLTDEKGIVAACCSPDEFERLISAPAEEIKGEKVAPGIGRLEYVYDIFRLNEAALLSDYSRMVKGRQSAPLDGSVTVIGSYETEEGLPSVFLEEGAEVSGAILNVKNGPIYIGKDAEIMEGCVLRGPIAFCDHSKARMGSKIYGGTTIGPYSKVGGEIDNTVIIGYSNKAHDGYLGNAVIGEWCNIGAGTNASNLKNDYSKIRLWNYRQQRFMRTDLQFCGLIMGDHSKAGINCMFNTATVVGVGVNLHGAGFPRVFIPSFSEGSPEGGFSNVSIDKFMTIAERVMSRRGLSLNDIDRRICEHIYASASRFKGEK